MFSFYRYSHNHIVTNGSMNNNNKERKGSSTSNLLLKHFNQKSNQHHRASSSSGSSSNSIKVGNETHFQQMKNRDPSSQFTKSIGMSNLSNGVGYSSFSPQDYLNNPMFDSLNASRYRRYWPTSGSSSDRTITLRPLMSTPKRNVHKRFQLSESCKVLWNLFPFCRHSRVTKYWLYFGFMSLYKYLWLRETSQLFKLASMCEIFNSDDLS